MEAPPTPAPSSPTLSSGAASVAPPAAAAAKPKSRPLRRKTSHSVIERRRREKINERLVKLQETVPACRLEAEEMLRVKMDAAAGRKKKGTHMSNEERERIIEAKVKDTMVLEKLCIISHTVDYLEELRSQLEAYRRLCRCSPPASLTAPLPEAQAEALRAHIASAHSGSAELDSPTDGAVSAVGAGDVNSSEAVVAKPMVTAAKRKRHWGSNREPRPDPPSKARRRKSSPSDPDDAPSNLSIGVGLTLARGARAAAVAARAAMQDGDDEGASDSGSNVDVEEEDGSVVSAALLGSGDSDSEDELAFNSPAPSSSGAALPISALYSSHPLPHAPTQVEGRKQATLPRRRFTDAGLTPDPHGSTSIETLHACGHSHAVGGPSLPWQPGASHHGAHAHAHAKPHLWGLPFPASRAAVPACWGPTTPAGLRLPPLLTPAPLTQTETGARECKGPPVALRPRSLSPGGTTTSDGRLHVLAALSSEGKPGSA